MACFFKKSMFNMQDTQRLVEERLPRVATCADELATMQCAALSCVAALLAAQAGVLTSANDSIRKGTQEAGELPLTFPEVSSGSLLRTCLCRKKASAQTDSYQWWHLP